MAALGAHTVFLISSRDIYMEPWASNSSAKALPRCCQPVQPHQVRSVYKRSSRSLGFSFIDTDSYAPTPERRAHARDDGSGDTLAAADL
jgi:hypothetical protein